MLKKLSTPVRIIPDQSLNVLSHMEVARLIPEINNEIYHTFRRCELAVLNTGSKTDDTQAI